ncbi:MAG: electron transport complex subunit E [Oligoflexia bacterium]|nr:electron transport complex subunit E [Oligoflexia bacterium]
MWQIFYKGIFKENPVLVLLLGLCPTLAVSSSVENGFGMGIAATFVLICSNIAISLVKNIIPDNVRIPCFIVIIASFVTIVDLLLAAYAPALHISLGIFIPLIVVNCIILGRAEAFASKKTILKSTLDAVGMGIGFTLALMLLGTVRELLGNGTWFGLRVSSGTILPVLIMIMPPGAFIALGFILAGINKIQARRS